MDAEEKSISEEVSLRFPNQQKRFFGPMAHSLCPGDDFDFTEMSSETHRRSDMFCQLALLMDKRGQNGAARKFLG